LNKLKNLRQVLKQDVNKYSNVELNWKGGAKPSAVVTNDDGVVSDPLSLEDWDEETFLAELAKLGFAPEMKTAEEIAAATALKDYNGDGKIDGEDLKLQQQGDIPGGHHLPGGASYPTMGSSRNHHHSHDHNPPVSHAHSHDHHHHHHH
jgi:hypothetical protein